MGRAKQGCTRQLDKLLEQALHNLALQRSEFQVGLLLLGLLGPTRGSLFGENVACAEGLRLKSLIASGETV